MGVHGLFFLLLLFTFHHGLSRADFPHFRLGSQVSIRLPPAYQPDFRGMAFLFDTGTNEALLGFKVGLSVEADGSCRYSCSLSVFLGDRRVWSSDYYTKFQPAHSCVLQLTDNGDLQLQDGSAEHVGWRSGTAGEGVQALQLQTKTGNLVLADAQNNTRWQSFDYPGNIMLWGQQLNAPSSLNSFSDNSSASYSLELQPDKLCLRLTWMEQYYYYWEVKPTKNRTFAFARLGSRGLKLYDTSSKKIMQLLALDPGPVRFLQLGDTGNIGLYHYSEYSPHQGEFVASYRAISSFCDLPLPCGPFGICSTLNSSPCMQVPAVETGKTPVCNTDVEMVHLNGINSILRPVSVSMNVSEKECVSYCKRDCSCTTAQYSMDGGQCFQYGLVGGAREVEKGDGSSYWVKVFKKPGGNQGSSSHSSMTKILIVVGVVDGVILCVIVGGFLYYWFKIRKRAGNSRTNSNS